MMKLETLMKEPPAHLLEAGDRQDTLLGVFVRTVRNLKGHPFPGWSTSEGRRAVAEALVPGLLQLPEFKRGAFHAEMPALDFDTRQQLLLYNLISPALAARQDGCHIIISQKKNAVAMVNEEEHLVIHRFRQGYPPCKRGDNLRVGHFLETVETMNRSLDAAFDFAGDTAKDHYLTSIPSECGCGIQIYALLHLPALNISHMMGQVTKAMEKLHVSISPYYSDGSDDTANRFMLYTVPAPGIHLNDIQEYFFEVVERVVEREVGVRKHLLYEPGQRIFDRVGRTYGMLKQARRLSVKEMRDAFSILRLGTVLDIIKWARGARKFIESLSALELELTVQAATMDDEDAAPLMLAERCRAFLKATPHVFHSPKDSDID